MGDAATLELRGEDKQLQEVLDRSLGSIKMFGKVALGVGTAIAGAFAFNKLLDFGKMIVHAGAEVEQVQMRLNHAIEASGKAAGFTADQIRAMADDMQKLTKYEGEAVQEAATLVMQFRNVKGDNFKETIKLSADLASHLKMDLSGAARMLGRALEEPERGMMMMRRAGIMLSKEQQEQVRNMLAVGDIAGAQAVILGKVRSIVGGLAEKEGKTFSGMMERLGHVIGDVWEELGGAFLPLLEMIIPYFEKAADAAVRLAVWFRESTDGMVDAMKTLWTVIEPTLKAIAEGFIVAFTICQTAITNWGDVSKFVVYSAVAKFLEMGNILAHLFTEVLPKYLTWFGDNWISIFENIGRAEIAILSNMWKNFTSFFDGLMSYIRGEGFEWQWTGLLDGFKSTLAELPQIAERVPGELESMFKDMADEAGNSIGDAFDKNLAENKKKLKEFQDFLFPDDAGRTGFDAKADFGKGGPKYEDNRRGKKDKKEDAGAFEDLLALNKRIQTAAYKTPEEKAIEDGNKQKEQQHAEDMDAMGEQNDLLEDVATEVASNTAAMKDLSRQLPYAGVAAQSQMA